MPTLNRFPLLGLWAKEAARRIGYREGEAAALGHAYAVFYAIRRRRWEAAGKKRGEEEEEAAERKRRPERPRAQRVPFGGDELPVIRQRGMVRGLVGGEQPQTPATYRASVVAKFPPGYYERLERCFRRFFRAYDPEQLQSGVVYDAYDRWKRTCGVGRLVDLDRLLKWCEGDPRRARRRGGTGEAR